MNINLTIVLITVIASPVGVPARRSAIYRETFLSGRRSGTQAWQSDGVVARAKPVAISRLPSPYSGQGFVALKREDSSQ
jgi:hypothetical protein